MAKNIPKTRQCFACKKRKLKEQLSKLVYQKATQTFLLDEKQVLNGRGVYICLELDCLQKAQKKKYIILKKDLMIKTSIIYSCFKEIENKIKKL